MTPFLAPEGPYTIEKIMEAIRTQVIEATGAPAAGDTAAPGEPAPLITNGGAASRLAVQLELMRQRQALAPAYRIRSHRRLAGWLIDGFKRLIHWGARPYIDLIRERQEALNEATLRALREAAGMIETQGLEFERSCRLLNETRLELLVRQEEIERALHALHIIPRINVQCEKFDERLTRFEGMLSEAAQRLDRHDGRYDMQPFFAQVSPEQRLAAINCNRGTYEDIEYRQHRYVELFLGAPGQVLDAGCGRGELLNLLRINGVEGWGAEVDPLMIEQARAHGVHVIQADALTALSATPPGTLGGVFAAQVVEHFFPGELLSFLRLAHERLAPGGRLVIETLNPAALGVIAKSYFRDIDHKQALHPEYLRILVELAGFEAIELQYVAPFREDERLSELPPAAELGLTEAARNAFQERLDRVDRLLFGMQDYYIVARRGAAPAATRAAVAEAGVAVEVAAESETEPACATPASGADNGVGQ